MARHHQIQYVSFYTAGSEARKVDWQPVKKQVNLPQPRRAKRKVVYVDPVANIGIVVAVVMLLGLCACGGSEDNSTNNGGEGTANETAGGENAAPKEQLQIGYGKVNITPSYSVICLLPALR